MSIKRALGRILRNTAAAGALLAVSSQAQAAVIFNFSFTAGTSVAAQNAFIAAGNRWSSLFSDNVTVAMTVGTASLGAGILAQANSTTQNFSYSSFKNALTVDRTSANDFTAVASLDSGSSFNMLINGTSDNPFGSGSATPYLDAAGANNTQLALTTANAKALGMNPTLTNLGGNCLTLCDGFIQFSNSFAFDFDPSNGINVGQYDFIGIATHEIGHSLGFVSGVDVLDFNFGPFAANQFTFVSPLDMFRYSAASTAAGAIDWTADNRAKYFSIDGGATVGPLFSNGVSRGDGRQASHWKDNLGLGIMDPTAATGELLAIGSNDITAFDVIGWNLNLVPGGVPEPATWAMMILGFGFIGGAMRRANARQLLGAARTVPA